MRVIYLLTSLGVGGAEKQALAVAERMSKRGHAVAVMTLLPRVSEEWPTSLFVVHLNVSKSPLSVFAGLRRARQFLREFRPGLIHSHCFHANIFARLLRLTGGRFAVLSTVHNIYEGRWWRMLAYRLTDPLCKHTVAVSISAQNRFARLGAVPARKSSVITNGFNVSNFIPHRERRAKMRAEMGINSPDDGNFVWLAVGRISPAKDYPNLLRAFAVAAREHRGAQLLIAGDGCDPDRAKLETELRELGIGNQARFVGLRRDIAALLDAADGFVLSSAWEGMPLVVGEAMAMQKPVVASSVGGVRELVGDSGLLVPAKNPQALAEAMIATMQRSREELVARGHAARARIVSDFNIDDAANTWEALYRQLTVHSGQ
jgi:glycosyltransferase involved in cell wall biosynthesis